MITLLNKFDDNYVMVANDILDVCNDYIKTNHLEKFLSDVNFDSKNSHMGSYNIRTKKIFFNDKKIIESGYRMFDKSQIKYDIDQEYYTYFLNFYYLYTIYHELTHVSQTAKYENVISDKNIFNYLYELCFKLHYSDVLFYKDNHDIFPMEIDANNNGYLIAYKLLSYTKLPSKELSVMRLQYLYSLLLNYEKISDLRIMSPIEKLFGENQNIDIYKIYELTQKSKLSKIERMNLGIGITPKEYNSVYKEKQKILLKR